MTVLLVVSGACFGLAVGSFLNVVALRTPLRESLLTPSHCRSCGTTIRAWQNVPVLSWLALRGRCAACRAPISARYPLVEAATGLAFAVIAPVAGWALAVPGCLLAAVAIALALLRLARRRPDRSEPSARDHRSDPADDRVPRQRRPAWKEAGRG